MSAKEYTQRQLDIINRYYRNLSASKLQRLGELVTDLYLADSPARQKRLWEQVEAAMIKLDVPETLRSHILGHRSVEVLAENVQDWLKKAGS